ncbi:diaminopimelate decarboxylase [Desulfurivibrio alkaliphilus]|uniref:Diaminopimelate decarboxylase n=1 Tax=Desulfurivibrio alkaliphilus (strain DSM 19089 / UNIQEM U267 / AHT2) TaxID=589865 RepID=D6Z6B5_DESAT|nr:diaminopimelate decarboxylase [Desulfurivibrio alkaliphilus]ADH86880.1 diaminopimelate decarboxylase [Desulfurivibrio alkaliphilus AHT 2]
MDHFQYRDGVLGAEEVPVPAIAEAVGTPFYLYSTATLERHFKALDDSFADLAHLTCFAVKACSNIAILRLFARLGGGADIVSGGELYRALAAGIDPGKIVYSGVGKTRAEIRQAIEAGILMFNLESEQELEVVAQCATELQTTARISFRVNPDVDPQTHAYISTGLAKNKFGIPIAEAPAVYRRARELAGVEIVGVSCHIGSQLTKVSPFVDTIDKLKKFLARLAADGIAVKYLDIGGGLGIKYNQEEPPEPAAYGAAVRQALGELDCTLILEPGRVIVGNAGIMVTRVLYTKSGPKSSPENSHNGQKKFIVVDAGMNDLFRPSLYDAYHAIVPVVQGDGATQTADVVGPICETGDFLARDQEVPAARPGELLAVKSAGAYGFTMASNYNSRPRVAEVLVNGTEFHVIRRRESYEDLIRGEEIPAFLNRS